MRQIGLSRELALRIGLAAHALPDTDTKGLLVALSGIVKLPITEKKLAAIELKTLKTVFSGTEDRFLTQVLQLLKNGRDAPVVAPLDLEGGGQGFVRIACASDDGVNVDGHFGSCRQFMIYLISAEAVRLVDVRPAAIPEGGVVDDKNVYRAQLIRDCKVVYMVSVGGPAAAKIVKQGIHPIKLPAVQALADTVSEFQKVIATAPPPWLAKIMGIDTPERLRFAQETDG